MKTLLPTTTQIFYTVMMGVVKIFTQNLIYGIQWLLHPPVKQYLTNKENFNPIETGIFVAL